MREYPELSDDDLEKRITSINKNLKKRQKLIAPILLLLIILPTALISSHMFSTEVVLLITFAFGACSVYGIYVGVNLHKIDTEEVLETLGYSSVHHSRMYSERFHENDQYQRDWDKRGPGIKSKTSTLENGATEESKFINMLNNAPHKISDFMYKNLTILLVLLIALCIGYSQVIVPKEIAQENIDNNEIPIPIRTVDSSSSEIADKYSDGWDEAVGEVFSVHDDLYYDGAQYSSDDFSAYDGIIDSTSVEDARSEGYVDAIDAIFSDTDVLCYGTERYYRDDY